MILNSVQIDLISNHFFDVNGRFMPIMMLMAFVITSVFFPEKVYFSQRKAKNPFIENNLHDSILFFQKNFCLQKEKKKLFIIIKNAFWKILTFFTKNHT